MANKLPKLTGKHGESEKPMKRREFLKVAGVSAAALAFAPELLLTKDTDGGYPHFDPSKVYGQHYIVSNNFNAEAINILDRQVIKVVPPKCRHKVRWFYKAGDSSQDGPLGQRNYIMWYYKKHPNDKKVTIV